MQKLILVMGLLAFSFEGFATCLLEETTCRSNDKMDVEFKIYESFCSPPGGPGTKITTYKFRHPFFGQKEIKGSHDFKMTLKNVSDGVELSIVDHRKLKKGEIGMTRNAFLEGYQCQTIY